jgi:hypothetical protein
MLFDQLERREFITLLGGAAAVIKEFASNYMRQLSQQKLSAREVATAGSNCRSRWCKRGSAMPQSR